MNASTTTEQVVGSNLTTIAEYTDTAAALAELRQRHEGVVYDVRNPKELKKAKEARAEVKGYRVALEKMRVEIKAPALERCRQIDSEAKRITAELLALEEPLDNQIKAEEARVEEERLRKLEEERQRVEAIQQKIQDLRDVAASLVGKPSVIIQGRLERLRSEAPTEDEFAEHFLAAQDAHTAAIARVEQQLQAQLDHEAEQKRIEEERAELERMRAENERLQGEAEERRLADEERERAARAEQERKEREAREAEERRVATIRQKIAIAAEAGEDLDGRSVEFIAQRKSRFEAFLQENAGFDFQEFADEWQSNTRASLACIDTCLSAAQEIERIQAERRAEEERQLQAERERQAAEQKRLDEQAEKLKREREEAARKAEADRLASLTLRTAAQAVLSWLTANGHSQQQVTKDLMAALANDAAQAQPATTTRARGKKAANA